MLSLATVSAVDWPGWRGLGRDAVTTESGWTTNWPSGGPPKLWEAEVGIGSCSVAVSDGRVFTAGNDDTQDTIFAFDAATGKPIWKHSYAAPVLATQYEGGPAATPTVDKGRLYTLSREGLLLCLEAATGKKVWSADLVKDLGGQAPRWMYATSPLVDGDLVIAEPGGRGSSVVAFNKTDGRVVWKSGSEGTSYSSPVAFDFRGKRCVAIFNVFGLVILDKASGKELARHPWKTSYDINAATPIIAGERIFISSGYKVGCALLEFTGNSLRELWRNKNMHNQFNSCVLWQGHIYGFDEKELRCLDLKTGESKWSQGGMGKASLIVADGKLVIMSEKGELVVAEATPAGYKELARASAVRPRSWVTPVLANGKIYAKNNRGDLVCFDVSRK